MILALLVAPASAQNNVITVDSDRSAEVVGNSTDNGYTRSTNSLDNNGNTVTVSAAVTGNYSVFGTAWLTDGTDVKDNTVTITGNGSVSGSVSGGRNGFSSSTSSTTLSGNKVIIDTTGSGTVVGYSIYGGRGDGAAALTGNHVTIKQTNTGHVAGDILGGDGDNGIVSSNTVTIQGSGNVGGKVYGGYALNNGTVTDNTVYIGKDENDNGTYSGTITGPVYGGYSYSGNADSNKVFISSGTVSGDIYGGYVDIGTGSAINNTVNISTTGAIYNAIYGGGTYSGTGTTGDLFTGNTLNLKADNTVNEVINMNIINFTSSGDAGIGTLDTEVRGGTTGTLVKLNTNDNNVDFGGDITGNGGIEKIGTGTLTLSGTNNTYSGGTTVSDGTLEVTGTLGTGAGTGGSNDYAGDIINNSELIFNQSVGTTQTLSGVISGNGNLTKDGTGTLILSGANIYTGLTEVKSGTLELSGSGSISDKLVRIPSTKCVFWQKVIFADEGLEVNSVFSPLFPNAQINESQDVFRIGEA
ncbi:hypothetical protein FACS189443_2330 [Planctomycetales bacterium]|nr:hypothetical protein FACS189443_2330 [Planctomycetales bacterium]